jgi:hypothetical protein
LLFYDHDEKQNEFHIFSSADYEFSAYEIKLACRLDLQVIATQYVHFLDLATDVISRAIASYLYHTMLCGSWVAFGVENQEEGVLLNEMQGDGVGRDTVVIKNVTVSRQEMKIYITIIPTRFKIRPVPINENIELSPSMVFLMRNIPVQVVNWRAEGYITTSEAANRKHGYDQYLPASYAECAAYYLNLYGIVLHACPIYLSEVMLGGDITVLPTCLLVESCLELPLQTKRHASSIVSTFMRSLELCCRSLIHDEISHPKVDTDIKRDPFMSARSLLHKNKSSITQELPSTGEIRESQGEDDFLNLMLHEGIALSSHSKKRSPLEALAAEATIVEQELSKKKFKNDNQGY